MNYPKILKQIGKTAIFGAAAVGTYFGLSESFSPDYLKPTNHFYTDVDEDGDKDIFIELKDSYGNKDIKLGLWQDKNFAGADGQLEEFIKNTEATRYKEKNEATTQYKSDIKNIDETFQGLRKKLSSN